MKRKYENDKARQNAINQRRRLKREQHRIQNNIKIGRPKTYHSEEERINANRKSSLKYYHKNKKNTNTENDGESKQERDEKYKKAIINQLIKEDFSYHIILTFRPVGAHDIYSQYLNGISKIDAFNQKHQAEREYNPFPYQAYSSYQTFNNADEYITDLRKKIPIKNYLFIVEKTKDSIGHIHLVIEPTAKAKAKIQTSVLRKIIDKTWGKGQTEVIPIPTYQDKVNVIHYILKQAHTVIDNQVDIYKKANHWMYDIQSESEEQVNYSDLKITLEIVHQWQEAFLYLIQRLNSLIYFRAKRLLVKEIYIYVPEIHLPILPVLSTHFGGGTSPPLS